VRNNLRALLLPMAKVNKSRERGEERFTKYKYFVSCDNCRGNFSETRQTIIIVNYFSLPPPPPLCSRFDLIHWIIMTLYGLWR